MNLIAIDVSKEKLDILFDYSGKHTVIQNTKKDIKKLITKIKKLKNAKLIFEASGGYDKCLKNIALEAGINCCICNGRRVREFARSQGLLAKTDKLDTYVIAQYAKASDLIVTNSRDNDREALKELNVRRRQILDLINQEENKLEHDYSEFVTKSINSSLEYLRKELSNIEDEIEKFIEGNAELKKKKELLETIPGIGKVTAITLIADLPELGKLSKSKIASLAGLAPMNHDSGKFSGQRKTKHSRRQIKSVLYMAAISATKSNPRIKSFYGKLKAKGKKGKVALVACMRKLVIYANAMLKEGKEFKA